MYGGLPKILDIENIEDKTFYLKNSFKETYIKDILERNDVRNPVKMEELLDYLSSAIGGLTNPKKLADTFKTVKNVSVHSDTIKNYLDYFTDCGLRNVRINFRQYEETHIMENVIYNELVIRGYHVDVGMVEYNYCTEENKRVQKQLEVDFVCNQGSKRVYIQSALALPTYEKEMQEQQPLRNINDSFKKIIIVKEGPTHYNEEGILILNLFDFLLEEDSLNQ